MLLVGVVLVVGFRDGRARGGPVFPVGVGHASRESGQRTAFSGDPEQIRAEGQGGPRPVSCPRRHPPASRRPAVTSYSSRHRLCPVLAGLPTSRGLWSDPEAGRGALLAPSAHQRGACRVTTKAVPWGASKEQAAFLAVFGEDIHPRTVSHRCPRVTLHTSALGTPVDAPGISQRPGCGPTLPPSRCRILCDSWGCWSQPGPPISILARWTLDLRRPSSGDSGHGLLTSLFSISGGSEARGTAAPRSAPVSLN